MADHNVSHKESIAERSSLTSLIQWLQLKRYQFEVMIPLYMLTPTECAVFYVVVATLLSMFLATAYLYLPNHISIISNRVYYYIMGELTYMSSTVGGTAGGLSQMVRKTSGMTVDSAAHTAVRTAASLVGRVKEL